MFRDLNLIDNSACGAQRTEVLLLCDIIHVASLVEAVSVEILIDHHHATHRVLDIIQDLLLFLFSASSHDLLLRFSQMDSDPD